MPRHHASVRLGPIPPSRRRPQRERDLTRWCGEQSLESLVGDHTPSTSGIELDGGLLYIVIRQDDAMGSHSRSEDGQRHAP